MSSNEIARPKVILDGKQAEQELDRLTQKANKYRDAMLAAASVGDSKAQKQAAANYKAATKEISNFKKEALSVEGVLKNINGASFNEISAASRKATADLKKMKQTDPGYADQIKNVTTLKSKLSELNQSNRSTMTFWEKMKSSASSLLPVIGIAAAFAGAKQLVSNIISVRKEFEKYEAVLTNTLGSNKKARNEMQMLQKFAAETPFALTELTGSFVKLTNYGLKPNREEMRKYGDLASSVGKGFDQLTEAVADAVTGEFERLKEFGIKTKKEGDKITFTFKEQSTVIANNSQSIKDYITGLGDLQGVAGSMAAIAGTLGGKISNMGDAWDGLMNTMGSGTGGVMVTVIGWMTSFVNTLDNALKSVQQIKEAVKDQSVVDSMNNALKEIDVMEKSLVRNGVSQAEAHTRAILLYNKSIDDGIASTQAKFRGQSDEQKKKLASDLNLMIEERKAVTEHFKNLDNIKKNQKGGKINDPKAKTGNNDDELKALDVAYKQQQLWLKERYAGEETLQKEYNARKLANELAYLEAKQQLSEDDSSYLDLQSQIIDKQNEYNAALKETVPELLNALDGTEKLNTRLLEEAKLMNLVAAKQAEAANATEEMKAKQESLANMYQGTIEGISSGIYEMASGTEDALKTMAKNLLLFALEQLKMQTELAVAGVTIQGLASLNPAMMLAAAVKIAAIEVVFAGIEGLINNAFSSKKGEKKTGYASGGFTNGEATYTAGEAGKEYIAPAWQVSSPITGPLIYELNKMRETGKPIDITSLSKQNGTIAAPNIRAINRALANRNYGPIEGRSFGYSNKTNANRNTSEASIIDQKQSELLGRINTALDNNTHAVALLMKKGVSFPMVSAIKQMKEVEDLLNQTGIGGFKPKG